MKHCPVHVGKSRTAVHDATCLGSEIQYDGLFCECYFLCGKKSHWRTHVSLHPIMHTIPTIYHHALRYTVRDVRCKRIGNCLYLVPSGVWHCISSHVVRRNRYRVWAPFCIQGALRAWLFWSWTNFHHEASCCGTFKVRTSSWSVVPGFISLFHSFLFSEVRIY